MQYLPAKVVYIAMLLYAVVAMVWYGMVWYGMPISFRGFGSLSVCSGWLAVCSGWLLWLATWLAVCLSLVGDSNNQPNRTIYKPFPWHGMA